MKIMVIDSEPQTRQLLRTFLEANGYEVIEPSGDEGDDEMTQTDSDAALMDLRPSVGAPAATFRCGALEVDAANRAVFLRGHKVELTSTEYLLLEVFIRHVGKVLTHGFLLREIWGTTDAAKMGRLRFCISHLREKLERQAAQSELLLANTGIGYRLVLREKNC